jgi:hypothetical protein
MFPSHLLEFVDGVVQGGFLLGHALDPALEVFGHLFSRGHHVELAASPVGDPVDLHLVIRFKILVPDHIFQARVVGLVLALENVDVEEIVPKIVLFLNMALEGLILLFKSLP